MTFAEVGVIVQASATAATTLFPFVYMPLGQHGSRKAIEHWRGFHGSPLEQNPQTANLGGVFRKVIRCQEEMKLRPQTAEDSSKVCRSFDGTWRGLIWGANNTGCVLRPWMGVVVK